jgi:hypothetical protein
LGSFLALVPQGLICDVLAPLAEVRCDGSQPAIHAYGTHPQQTEELDFFEGEVASVDQR